MEPLSPLGAAVLAIVTATISIVVGFGVITNETAGIVTAAAGTIIPAIFVIVNEARHKTLLQAGKISR